MICPEGTYLEELVRESGCGSAFRNGESEGLASFLSILANNNVLGKFKGQQGRKTMETEFTVRKISEEYCKALGITSV